MSQQDRLPTDVSTLAEGFRRHGGSLYLGRDAGGQIRIGTRSDHLLVLGPPRCGKTSSLIAPSIIAHPGPVIVTSTRADLIEATLQPRTRLASEFGGEVGWVSFGQPQSASCEALEWRISDGCKDWNTALDRAFDLVAAAYPPGGGPEDDFWRNTNRDVLSACLHGAALMGLTDQHMSLDIRAGNLDDYRRTLADYHEDSHPAQYALQAIYNDAVVADDTRRSIFATLAAQVLGQFAFEQTPTNRLLHLDDFVSGWGTIYLTMPLERKTLVPLISSFIEAVMAAWRRSSNLTSGTLLLALDEVANVAPIPSLPSVLTAGGGDRIQAVLGMQEPGQMGRWGPSDGAVVAGASTHLAVFGGLRNAEYLNSLAKMAPAEISYDTHYEPAGGLETQGRQADQNRLISERKRLEDARSAAAPLTRKTAELAAAHRLATARRLDGITPRVGTGSATDLITELETHTRVKPVPSRRPSIEAADLAHIPRGQFYLRSTGRSEIRTALPWDLDSFWSSVG